MTVSGLSALNDFMNKEFGGVAEIISGVISVTTGMTPLVGNDPDALALTLINVSANTVYVTPDNSASPSRGIVLNSGGGAVSLNVRDDLTLPGYEWYGVASAGTADVYFVRARRLKATG